MASVKVKSGGSLKGRKGNPMEYDTAYSLKEGGYSVERMDDNTAGIDLIAWNEDAVRYYLECKNRQGLSWNALEKIYKKTSDTMEGLDIKAIPLVVFKSNRQPVLVMSWDAYFYGMVITPFYEYFKCDWSKRPKGYKLWR